MELNQRVISFFYISMVIYDIVQLTALLVIPCWKAVRGSSQAIKKQSADHCYTATNARARLSSSSVLVCYVESLLPFLTSRC